MLAIGVAVNEARDGQEQIAAPTTTPGPEVLRMLELEADASKLRDVIAPDAYLFRMQYHLGRSEESYGFFYAITDGFVSITQPSTQRGDEAWSISTVHIGGFAPEPLDLARVTYAPADIYGAAVSRGAASPRDQCGDACLVLLLDAAASGSPHWQVIGVLQKAYQVTQVNCAIADNSSLQGMTCGPTPAPWFTASPSPATPLPIQTAADVQEVVDVGLKLARVFEPEAHLFALNGLVDNAFEFSHYQLGFTTPDGRTQIGIYRDSTRWQIEILDLDDPEPQPGLDVSGLQKGPREVSLAGFGDGSFRASFSLKGDDGRLFWDVSNNSFEQSTCALPDAGPLSEIVCEVEEATPTPAPPAPTPGP
jgi:hypothetical protein